VRTLVLGAVLLALVAAPDARAAHVQYPYRLTVDGSGSASFNASDCCVNESGTESTSYKAVYDILVTVDDEQQTVDVAPNDGNSLVTGAKTFSGLDSFDSTRTCIDPSCTGPDTHCTFADVAVGTQYILPENVYLQDNWGYGTDHPTYTSGLIRLNQSEGGVAGPGDSIACTGTQTYTYPTAEKMPGLRGQLQIPLSEIGKDHFVVEQDVGPVTDPSIWQTGTGSWHYKITADAIPTTARIVSTTLDFDARAQRRIAKLRPQVVALAERKATLEDTLLDDQPAAAKLQRQLDDLGPQLKKIQGAAEDTATALRKLKRAQRDLPDGVDALIETESRYERELAELQADVLAAEKAGRDTTATRAKLAKVRKRLDAVDDLLTGKIKGTEFGALRQKWLHRWRTLKELEFDMQSDVQRLLAGQGALDAKLTAAFNELRDVDSRLFDLGERASRFEPEVLEVTARVDGTTAFHATASYPYGDLVRINERIAAQQKTLDRLKGRKSAAFAAFYEAEKDAIASQKYLAGLLHSLAWERFFTDLLGDGYDVFSATLKGGVVGAVAELGKKLIEKGLSKIAGDGDPGIDPGTLEAAVNSEFQAGLQDAYAKPRIVHAVAERVLKETLTKSLKDTANARLGSAVFDRYEYPFRFRLQVEPKLLAGTAIDYAKAEKSLDYLTKQLESLRKGYLGNFAGTSDFKKFLKGEAQNLIKDSIKVFVRGQLDRIEREAWVDFFVKDGIAKAYYVPYFKAADLWEKASSEMDYLLEQKAKLIGNASGEAALAPDLSEPFPQHGQIDVTLKLAGAVDPDDPVRVFVDGIEATRQGSTDTYSISGKQLNPLHTTYGVTLR
jgi:uncharacterized coiled-coil protein SlyX